MEDPHPPIPAIENVVDHPCFNRLRGSGHLRKLSLANFPVNISDVPLHHWLLDLLVHTSLNHKDTKARRGEEGKSKEPNTPLDTRDMPQKTPIAFRAALRSSAPKRRYMLAMQPQTERHGAFSEAWLGCPMDSEKRPRHTAVRRTQVSVPEGRPHSLPPDRRSASTYSCVNVSDAPFRPGRLCPFPFLRCLMPRSGKT